MPQGTVGHGVFRYMAGLADFDVVDDGLLWRGLHRGRVLCLLDPGNAVPEQCLKEVHVWQDLGVQVGADNAHDGTAEVEHKAFGWIEGRLAEISIAKGRSTTILLAKFEH